MRIFTLSILIICMAASTIDAQQTFIKNFAPFPSKAYATDFIKMSDNTFLYTGYTNSYGAGSSDIYCVLVNKNGKRSWSKTYGTITSESNVKCTATPDKGFILFAHSYDSTANKPTGALLIKCDANGNVQWTKRMNSKQFKYLQPADIIIDAKGNYILLFVSSNSMFPGAFFELVKLNNHGNLQWNTTVGCKNFAVYDNVSLYNIVEAADGKLIVSGNIIDQFFEGASSVLLGVFTNKGDILSLKSAGCSNCKFGEQNNVSDMVNIDKTVYIFGAFFYTENFFILPLTQQTDTTATAIAMKQNLFTLQYFINKKAPASFKNNFFSGIYFDKDSSMSIFNSNGMYFFKYDSKGRICPDLKIPTIDSSTSTVPFYVKDYPFKIAKDIFYFDSVTIFTGNVNDENTICESENFISDNTQENAKSINKISTQIFPNPASDLITAFINSEKFKPCTINIISVTGYVEKTSKASLLAGNNKVSINISDLSKGIYFFQVDINGTRTTVKFMKN